MQYHFPILPIINVTWSFILDVCKVFYNSRHNILEVCNVLVQIRVVTSETKLDMLVKQTLHTSCLTSSRKTYDFRFKEIRLNI